MLKQTFALSLFLFSAFSASSAMAQSKQIGVGTELKFKTNKDGAILFSPCKYEPKSSCAILKKVEKGTPAKNSNTDAPPKKVEKVCELLISDANVAKIEIPKDGRTLKVSMVGRDFEQVKSFVLEGTKRPIYFHCDELTTENYNVTRKNRFTLTQELLTGFQEFELQNVKFDTSKKPADSKTPKKPSQRNEGSTI